MSKLQAKGGVLIIGSLLWQDDLRFPNDNVRKNWRIKYLNMDNKISVICPIRYGRKSSSNIYTMVFSMSCAEKESGRAYMIPFKNTFQTTNKFIELAKELSKAEGMAGNFVAGNNAVWGVLGIALNPAISLARKDHLLTMWASQYSKEKIFDYQQFKLGKEKPVISENGILNLAWPNSVELLGKKAIDSLDFVLATVTKPTDYPHISDLLINVTSDITRKYFLNNISNGIQTFQDHYILEKIDKNILKYMNIETTD